MPIVSISINLSLAQNLNLLTGNFLLMTGRRLLYKTHYFYKKKGENYIKNIIIKAKATEKTPYETKVIKKNYYRTNTVTEKTLQNKNLKQKRTKIIQKYYYRGVGHWKNAVRGEN